MVEALRRLWHSASAEQRRRPERAAARNPLIAAGVFVVGLVIGSFLNVCIRRIPREESVVLPSSRCPSCQTPIKPYDNIPVLSWLLLGGKCRTCKTRISALYPAVELLTALLFLVCYLAFDLSVDALKWAIFSALLVVLTITDARERLLPDKVNFTGLGIGIALSLFTRPVDGSALWLANRLFAFPPPRPVLSLTDAALGAAAGSGLLWLVGEGYFRLRGREGMGLGDVKMMAMAGVFLGLKRTLLTILAGSLLGSVIGLLIIALAGKGRDYELPFGTFLGAGALLVVFFGTPMLEWYQALLTGH
jgi:leader peptidase (prepilin peptidase)/N-methyltransferase